MMFSMEKCLGRSGNGIAEKAELFAGGGEGLGKEGVPSEEVASAVAALSDEIGDVPKDELGDADRADNSYNIKYKAELPDKLANLCAVLQHAVRVNLAEGEHDPQQDYLPFFEIALGHRIDLSSLSSCSTGRQRQRRNLRSLRMPMRRAVAKYETARRWNAAMRRAVICVRRVEVLSDASDVGADSDAQRTEHSLE